MLTLNLKNSGKNIIKYLVTLLFIVFSIYYSVNDIDFVKLQEVLLNTNYLIAFLPIPVIALSHFFRALRWGIMLKPIKKKVSLMNLNSAVMIGYAANSILPIPRAGEFLRPFILSQREKISFPSVFATIVLERALDVFFLLLLFTFTFISLSHKIVNIFPKDINPNTLISTVLLFLLVLLISFYPPIFHLIINKICKPISVNLAERLSLLFIKFTEGLKIIKEPSAYIRLVGDSIIIWLLYALPLYITFFAFSFQNSLHLGIIDAIMLVIISGIGVSIAPTPGAIGVYHALVSTAMVQLYGLPKEVGLAYATIVHFVSYMFQVVVGGAFFIKENLNGLTIFDKFSQMDKPEL